MSGRAVAAVTAAGLVAGVALALAVTAATDEVYEATALLQAVAPDAEDAQAAAAEYADRGDSRSVDVSHPEGSALVEVVARAGTPAEARLLADAAVTRLVAEAERSARGKQLLVAAPASADDDPIRPRRVLNLVGGILLGLVAGLGSVVLYRRRPVRSLARPRRRSRPGPRTTPPARPTRAPGAGST